jgi:hypothetical protein
MKKFIWVLCAAALIVFSGSAFAMDITAFDTAENLAQALVGSGITISNVTYTGATAAAGYFSGGLAAGIGIDEGVVLTSGSASNLQGTSNTDDAITGDNQQSGAAFLDALIPGYSTNDAFILEFDFVSSGDAAYFAYVFGSDEYNEWVESAYNDVFGFFLDDTDVSDNVALIPGTSTPVSVNNVNGGDPFGAANASNPEYYNNNDPSDPEAVYPFEYDGFTDVFVATMLGLTPGQTYHLTLAIADAGDFVLDSGVFIQAGSFSDVSPIPEPSTMLLIGTGLIGLAGLSRRKFKK